eukprot:1150462-Pelagomonas_calceolata.AAC.4
MQIKGGGHVHNHSMASEWAENSFRNSTIQPISSQPVWRLKKHRKHEQKMQHKRCASIGVWTVLFRHRKHEQRCNTSAVQVWTVLSYKKSGAI